MAQFPPRTVSRLNRALVLEVAVELLTTAGPESLSIRRTAERSGASVSADPSRSVDKAASVGMTTYLRESAARVSLHEGKGARCCHRTMNAPFQQLRPQFPCWREGVSRLLNQLL